MHIKYNSQWFKPSEMEQAIARFCWLQRELTSWNAWEINPAGPGWSCPPSSQIRPYSQTRNLFQVLYLQEFRPMVPGVYCIKKPFTSESRIRYATEGTLSTAESWWVSEARRPAKPNSPKQIFKTERFLWIEDPIKTLWNWLHKRHRDFRYPDHRESGNVNLTLQKALLIKHYQEHDTLNELIC